MRCGRRGLTTVACVTQRPAVIYLVHLFSAWSELSVLGVWMDIHWVASSLALLKHQVPCRWIPRKLLLCLHAAGGAGTWLGLQDERNK